MMIQYTTFRFKFDKIFYSAIIVKHNKGGEIEKMEFDSKQINYVNAKKAKKAVFATGIGNAMEWFDFGLFAYLAGVIGHNFYTQLPSQMQLIYTYATMAIAFLLRPVGGIVFGILGDKFGRKVVLTSTIIHMAFSTLLIGLLPTYDQIGVWAPILLLIGRTIQGFSTGGEYAGAMSYIAETAPDKKRNRLGCGLEIGTLAGYIAASILIAVLTASLTTEQMNTWGWRIPFFCGLLLGLFGLYLRRRLEESPVYENQLATKPKEEKIHFFKIIRYYWKNILVCLVAVMFFNVTNYMITAYLPTYLEEIIKINPTTVSSISVAVMAFMIVLALMFGRLTDKIGEKKVFLIGLIGTAIFSVIAFTLFQTRSIPLIVLGVFMLGFFLSTYEATMPASLPSMFYTNVRYRTLAVTFNVSVSLFGGTTPLVASTLVAKTGNVFMPAYYLVAISVIGIVVITFLHVSTAGKSLKGSYPNVDNKRDHDYYVKYPEKALWWKKEQRI